nr:trypsin 3A1-like [Leptinotarsa decemlineata]
MEPFASSFLYRRYHDKPRSPSVQLLRFSCVLVRGDVDVTTVQEYRSEVETNNISYQVSLHTSYDDEFICGGTIVDATHILTVAHRLFYNWGGVLPPIIVSVKGGRNNLIGNASFTFGAKNVTFHPSFNKGTLDYDLAVIEIDGQFPFNVWNRTTITGKFIDDITSYEDCYLTGWNEVSHFF